MQNWGAPYKSQMISFSGRSC